VKAADAGSSPSRERAKAPMWNGAAVWELEGPRIMGPRTSLKMLMAFIDPLSKDAAQAN
jgi:hypothetical protein